MSNGPRSDRGPIAALVLLCVVLFGSTLGAHDFWEPDEPEFALVIRNMAERGDWVVPWQDGEPFADKPPLLYWSALVTTGGGRAFEGDAAWAPALARLPSALAALALVIGLYLFTAVPCGRRAALIAGAILATTAGFAQKARWLQTDMLFTAATCGAIMLFLAADRAPRSRPRRGWLLAGWGCLALGWLAKGPLALVLTGIAMGGHFALRPKGSLRRWAGTPAHLVGAALFLALVLPWYVLLWQRLGPEAGESFLRHHFLAENVDRLASASSHGQPPWYYLQRLPADFLPWTGLLLVTLAWAWRVARRGRAHVRTALAWAGLTVLALSFVSSKQGKYILPAYPPLAMLCGAWLDGPGWRQPMAKRTRFGVGSGAALAVLAGLVAVLAPLVHHPALERVPGLAPSLVPGGLLLVAGGCCTLVRLLLLVDPPRAAVDLALTVALGGAAVALGALPRMDDAKSARLFCEDAARTLGPGDAVAQYGAWRSAFPYHLRRETVNLRFPRSFESGDKEGRREAVGEANAATLAFLDRPGRGFLITRASYWERDMDETVRARLLPDPVVRRDIGGKSVVLLEERER